MIPGFCVQDMILSCMMYLIRVLLISREILDGSLTVDKRRPKAILFVMTLCFNVLFRSNVPGTVNMVPVGLLLRSVKEVVNVVTVLTSTLLFIIVYSFLV